MGVDRSIAIDDYSALEVHCLASQVPQVLHGGGDGAKFKMHGSPHCLKSVFNYIQIKQRCSLSIKMDHKPTNKLINRKAVRTVFHLLFFVSSAAYILNSLLSSPVLQAFKVVPLLILMLLIVPSSPNTTLFKVLFGLWCGLAGDLVLEYCSS
jgi:hypothetical protein